MAGRIKWTEERIRRLFEQGRGQGFGSLYTPFIQFADFSSRGLARRIEGRKIPRVHHFFSNVEYDFFLMLEWSRDVIDIREQYPLDRDATRTVAMELRVRHPAYVGTRINTVMTTDFLVTRLRDGQEVTEAYDTKRAEELDNPRTAEKLRIARVALERMGISHHIVPHSAIPQPIVRNIEWIRGARPILAAEDPNGLLQECCSSFLEALRDAQARNTALTLSRFCSSFDIKHALKAGMALRFARILLRDRLLSCPLETAGLAAQSIGAFIADAQPKKIYPTGGVR